MSLSKYLVGRGWTKPTLETESSVRSYSTTGDILSYRRCARQYGAFSVRGFVSATATQRYFGTLVHDVLDVVHRGWTRDGVLPDQAQVEVLVELAHDRLRRSGVRAYGAARQKRTATRLIHRFIESLGKVFFPSVQETEYRLQRALSTPDKREYILDGIVDVLTGAVLHGLGEPGTKPGDVEIWDYKSGRAPKAGHRFGADYEYQMLVYAELYKQQSGAYPARCVLVHLGELNRERSWRAFEKGKPLLSAFPDLIQVIDLKRSKIRAAMKSFGTTVDAIEEERRKPFGKQWCAPHPNGAPGAETCDACEIRYKCRGYPKGRAQAKQPL